jgi:hypothetical protein
MFQRGRGQGRGQGMQAGRASGSGSGRGRGSGGEGGGMGGGGFCVCPKCGQQVPHQPGTPCLQERCPACGVAMVREGSPHHQEIESRRAGGVTAR